MPQGRYSLADLEAPAAAPPAAAAPSGRFSLADLEGAPEAAAAPPVARTLSIGGVPYITGNFSDEELDAIGKSPAAQSMVAPSFSPGKVPAPYTSQDRPPERLGSAKTGGGAVEPPMGAGLPPLDIPAMGVRNVLQGTATIAKGAVTSPAVPPQQDTRVLRGRFTGLAGKATPIPDETLDAATQAINGLFATATPLAIGAAAAAPISTAITVGLAYLGDKTGAKATELMGGSKAEQDFAGALAGALAASGVGLEEFKRLAKTKIHEAGERARAEMAERAAAEEAAKIITPDPNVIDIQPVQPQRPIAGELAADNAPPAQSVEPPAAPTPQGENKLDAYHQARLAAIKAGQTPPTYYDWITSQQATPPVPENPQGQFTAADVVPPVDEAGRDLGGYAGPERRVTAGTPPQGVEERRLLPAEQVKEDLQNPEIVKQAEEMQTKAGAAKTKKTAAAQPETPAGPIPGSKWGGLDDAHREAFLGALGSFQHGNDRWQELRLRGATDQQILEQAGQEFGLGGSSGGPGSLGNEHKGGKVPHVILNPHSEAKVTLKGKALVGTIREALGIGPPVQTHGGGTLEARRPVGFWDINEPDAHDNIKDMLDLGFYDVPSGASSQKELDAFPAKLVKKYEAVAKAKGKAVLPEFRAALEQLEFLRDNYPEDDYAREWEVDPYIATIPDLERIVKRVEGQQELPEAGGEPEPPLATSEAPKPAGPRVGDIVTVKGQRGIVRELVTAGKKGGKGVHRLRDRARILFGKNGQYHEQFVDLDQITVVDAKAEAQVEKPAEAVKPAETAQPAEKPSKGKLIPTRGPNGEVVYTTEPVTEEPAAKPLDVIAVQRAWANLERPPQSPEGLASAVPSGQDEGFYRALATRYAGMADRAAAKARAEGIATQRNRWQRIANDWEAAAAKAAKLQGQAQTSADDKLHQENAVSDKPQGQHSAADVEAPTPSEMRSPMAKGQLFRRRSDGRVDIYRETAKRAVFETTVDANSYALPIDVRKAWGLPKPTEPEATPVAAKTPLTEDDRASAIKKLKALQKKYGVQRSRDEQALHRAGTQEEMATALGTAETEMKLSREESDKREAAGKAKQKAEVEKKTAEYIEKGRTFIASGTPHVWRNIQMNGDRIWEPMAGKPVVIPSAPAGATFSMFRDPIAKNQWRITEDTTGQAIAEPAKTQGEAVAAATAMIAKVGPEKFAEALKRGLKNVGPKPDLTTPEEPTVDADERPETPLTTVDQVTEIESPTEKSEETVVPKNPNSVSVKAFEVLEKALQKFGLDKPFPKRADEFRKWMAEQLGTTPAALAENIDEINDAAEAALAYHLQDDLNRVPVSIDDALAVAQKVEALLPKAHRTLEKTKLQQFSTPLPIAVLAGRAAQVHPTDRVLEPTAGTGNLLVSVPANVETTAVELSARRADLLRAQGINVVQGDYLGAKVTAPTVIISNPPWGKYSTGKYGQGIALGFTPVDVAERFVAKMLRDLTDGGRLVAVMPTTMLDSKGFKNWLRANYTVQAMIQAPPGAYDSRATGVDSVLLVVDKVKPEFTATLPPLPALVTTADWAAYAAAVAEVPKRDSIPTAAPRPSERPAGDTARPAPVGRPGRVPERPGSQLADGGRNAPVGTGRDTDVVAPERGSEKPGPAAGAGAAVVEQPERATLESLAEPAGEFTDVVDHAQDERADAAGSRQFAPYVRRATFSGVRHPKLIVEARQLAGVPYPPLTITPGPAMTKALREKRVSVEQAEQALAAVDANVTHHHGYLAADNVGVGKSREIALTILDLMERAKAAGRDLRLIVTTKSGDNIADLIDNELYYVATGRTKDGRDLLNVDAPKQVPSGLPFQVVKMAEWPDAKREGQAYKPLPRHPHALYVTDFYNLAAYRQALVDVSPQGIIGDEAHRFKNVEGAAAGGAWQNLHAEIIRGNPRDQQVFAYFTATPAQAVDDYQYLYGLRLWPIDGFGQWAQLVTGHGNEKDAAALEKATDEGAFNIGAVTGNTGPDVVGGDAEDVGKKDKPSKYGAKSYSDIFTSRLTPAEAEQIPREWKMLGRFSARDLWRHGQEFIIHNATLAPHHVAKYDQFAQLAQDIAKAAFEFGLLDKSGKSSRFGVTGQLQFAAKRIQMQPALEEAIKLAKTKLAEGYQVVLSVINVSEMNPEAGNIAAAIEKINTRIKDADPDDPDGGVIDLGEIPEALVRKAELLEQAKALGTFPDPIAIMEDEFGPDQVAFIVGDSGNARRIAMKEFQEGKRKIAFLSQAGSTGINLDHRVLTKGGAQGRRVFIDVQFEWSATEAIQRYGRVGRAASVTQPVLMPLTFGNASEKKFLATIANRMASLGALSKGGAETTGASGLEEFEITGPDAAAAARAAYNDLSEADKRKFAVVKSVFRSPNRSNDDPFEPAATAPASAGMRDAQLALLFVPMKTANAFWQSFVTHREAIRESLGHATSLRTEAYTGEILRTTDLSEPGKPLTLTEVKNLKGQRFGVLSGIVTSRMPKIREYLVTTDERGFRNFSRKYVTFTAGDQIVAGLQIPWGKVHELADAFGADLAREKLDTPAKVLAALKAGEPVALDEGHTPDTWTLRMRKDGKIAIDGAKMADRAILLQNHAAFMPVGNFFFTSEAKLADFLERFPAADTSPKATQVPKKKNSSGGGTTLQATVLPGAAEFLEQDVLPGLKSAADTFAQAAAQLQRAVAPATVGAGKQAAGSLRAMMAAEAQNNARVMAAAEQFQQAFDRLLAQPGGRDKAIDWWDAVQLGQPDKILPELKAAADYMRSVIRQDAEDVHAVSGKLEDANENYFAQIWKFPKAEANWVRRKLAGLMGKRPFEGSKSFLKQRKYPTFREGLTALRPKGIEPISYNPVDHFMLKHREMRRYIVARQAIKDFEAMGIWKAFGGIKGPKPEGWTRIDGPLGTIYGAPEVRFKEAFDPDLFEGLERFAQSLGVRLARQVNIGGRRWGYAEVHPGMQGRHARIVTKAAGPEGVLMHEIGHILDERFGLRTMVNNKKFKQELRDLADLRHEGTPNDQVPPGRMRYERKGEEKIANLVHAFLYAPERAKALAPHSYWALYNLAKKTPELRNLLVLQKTRSLKLGTRSHAIPLGGFPEIGFYAMPDDAARVFNNHLSRGLAGRSAIYDAYRWLNNTMVTGQLAASGLFHLTFTGIDALASQGGLALQELVGGVEQRNRKMLARGATRAAVTVGTGAVGAGLGYAVGGPLGILWAAGYPLAAMKFIKGWRGKREWLTQDPAGRFFADHVRQMNEGGFRPTWDQFYDNGAMKNAMRALRSGNYPGALARAIPAMLDAVTRPVMSWWVPGLKTANYLESAAFELDRLATEVGAVEDAEKALAQLPQTPKERAALKPEERAVITALEAQRADNLAVIRHALNRVQASMDNRFGEVVYDNWFWERWLKDLAHVLLRSPGWQAGTYKGVVGGVLEQGARIAGKVKDARHGPSDSTSEKESILAGDMAWILSMIAMSMLMGGLTHYLSTGDRPSRRDWFNPKGPDGKRRSILTYLPRLVSAYLHPVRTAVGISAPLNTLLARTFITNETWDGALIRQPEDPWLRQAWDALTFAAKEGYQPFLAQNLQRGEGKVESLMGVTPAAAEWQRSDAENYLHDALPPSPSRNHEEQAKLEARRALREAIKNKDSAAAKTAIQQGALSRLSQMAVQRSTRQGSLVSMFEQASLSQAIHAYELATPEERRVLRPLLAKKWHSLVAQVPGDARPAMQSKFLAASKLPVSAGAK